MMIFPVFWSDRLFSPANGVVDLGLMMSRKGILRSARPRTPKQKQKIKQNKTKSQTKKEKEVSTRSGLCQALEQCRLVLACSMI